MLALIKEQMDKAREEGTTKTGFLIDGYPREKDQGILFEKNVRDLFLLTVFLISSTLNYQHVAGLSRRLNSLLRRSE